MRGCGVRYLPAQGGEHCTGERTSRACLRVPEVGQQVLIKRSLQYKPEVCTLYIQHPIQTHRLYLSYTSLGTGYRLVTRTGHSHLPKLSWCAAMAGPEEVISSWEQSEQNCASGGLEEAAEWRREKIRMEEQYLANCIMDNN